MAQERTLVLVKPHAVHEGLLPDIVTMLLQPGLSITARKEVRFPSRRQVSTHYWYHWGRDYYRWIRNQLEEGPVVCFAIEGQDAVSRIRAIVGPTDPAANPPDTIRGRFGHDSLATSREEKRAVRNVVHAAATPAEAARELKIWFRPNELIA